MTQFVLAEAARSDLIEIWEYLDERAGPEIAHRIIDDLRKAVRILVKNPAIVHRREDQTRISVLFWPVQSYLFICDPESNPLSIVRVLHASRNLPSIIAKRRNP